MILTGKQLQELENAFSNSFKQYQEAIDLQKKIANRDIPQNIKIGNKVYNTFSLLQVACAIFTLIGLIGGVNGIIPLAILVLFYPASFVIFAIKESNDSKNNKIDQERINKCFEVARADMRIVNMLGYEYPEDICYYTGFSYFIKLIKKDYSIYSIDEIDIDNYVIASHEKLVNDATPNDKFRYKIYAEMGFYSKITHRTINQNLN